MFMNVREMFMNKIFSKISYFTRQTTLPTGKPSKPDLTFQRIVCPNGES